MENTHIQVNSWFILECLHAQFPCLESSPTPSHLLMPCMKIVSKQKYLFYSWATLQYKYVGQSSEANLLGNSLKLFMGLSDVNCWTISQHNSSDNFSIKFYSNKFTKEIIVWTTLRFYLLCTHTYYFRVPQCL